MHPSHRYTPRCMLFLVLWANYGRFIKGFACIVQPLSEYLAREGPARSQSGCHSPQMQWRPSRHWNKHAWQLTSWCSLTTPNHSWWGLMHPKTGHGVMLLQKQTDGWYHPIAYGSRALMPHEKIYHSFKLRLSGIKWAVTEHFKEYLAYQSLVVSTGNNPLTYINVNT